MTTKTQTIRFLKPHRGHQAGSLDPSPAGVFPPSALSPGIQETLVMRGVAEWVEDPRKPVKQSRNKLEASVKELDP